MLLGRRSSPTASTRATRTAARSSRRRRDARRAEGAEADARRRGAEPVRFAGNLVVAAFFAGGNDKQRRGEAGRAVRPLSALPRRTPTCSSCGRRRTRRRALASGTAPGAPVPLGDRVPGGVRPAESGVRRDRRQPAVRRARTQSARGTATATSTGSRRSTRSRTATPTWWPTSSAGRSTCCGRGTFGLIATNTIGQGDTRSTGLRWIRNHGGTIYAAAAGTSGRGRRPWWSAWFTSVRVRRTFVGPRQEDCKVPISGPR